MAKLIIAISTLVLVVGCGKDDPPAPAAPSPSATSKLDKPPGDLPKPPSGGLPAELRPPKE
jgi:hypothetical protein